jgi:hypothetical protein
VVRSEGSYCSRILTTDQLLNGASGAGAVVFALLAEGLVACERDGGLFLLPFGPLFVVLISAGLPFLDERLDFILFMELVFFFESLVGELLVSDSVERAGECERGYFPVGGEEGGRKSKSV